MTDEAEIKAEQSMMVSLDPKEQPLWIQVASLIIPTC